MKRSQRIPHMFFMATVLALAMVSLTPAALPENLVAYYKLDATSGDTAIDETGNHEGTLTGALAWVAGYDGNALQFQGGNGSPFVNLGAWQTDGPEGLGLAIWARWDGVNSLYQGLISQRDGTMYWWTELSPDGGQLRFKSNTSPQSNHTVTGEHLIEGEWTHYACSHNAQTGTAEVYVNGEERINGGWSLPDGDFSGLRTGIGVVNTADGLGTFNGALDEVMVFNGPLSAEDVVAAMQGFADPTASLPAPDTGAVDVPRDVAITWKPGPTAVAHDVYFGTSFDDVSAADRSNPLGVLLSEAQDANTYDPEGLLDFGKTYYWRIDEVNAGADADIFKGTVWNFTVEPLAYPIENIVATTNGTSVMDQGPQRTVDGSGLNASDQHSVEPKDMWLATLDEEGPLWLQYEFDRVYQLHEMWVWNYNIQFESALGFGLKEVVIDYSADGDTWTNWGIAELAQGTCSPDYVANTVIDFGGAAVRYVSITVNSKWGEMTSYGLSEVRFLHIPGFARESQPASGSAEVSVAADLSWRAGRGAETHEVYLDTDEAMVADGTALVDTVDTAQFSPGGFDFGTTYYWKVNEVNDVQSWEGDIWSFATQEYRVIDDFESYDDEDNLIYETWIDGWDNGTRSTVGYWEAPFTEQTIVHGGLQSMPLSYDDSLEPYYSETELDLGGADWTANGADTLRVFVRGQTSSFTESSDGTVVMSAIGTDVWGTADEFRYAYKTLNGEGSIVARVDAVGNSNTWAKAGVMIRESLETDSCHGFVVVTPSNGVSFQRRPVTGESSADTTQAGLVAPYWVKLTRSGNSFTAERSADGVTWQPVTDDAAASTVEIPMADTVYIGLGVTSHDADVSTWAQFSEIATTGDVSGQWQTADVGATQPTGGNAADTFYVALEDGAGRTAVVTHETAAVISEWQEWLISLSDFEGVALDNLKTLYLGLGDRDNPTAGGAGLVFIDDIAVGHPAAE